MNGYGITVSGLGAGAAAGVPARGGRPGHGGQPRDRSGNYHPPLSEDAFQSRVMDAAKQYGWKAVHYRKTLKSGGRTNGGKAKYTTPVQGDRGGPDLLLAKAGRLPLLVELKTDTGRMSPEQKAWREAIHPDVYRLWRPRDWDAIVAELSS